MAISGTRTDPAIGGKDRRTQVRSGIPPYGVDRHGHARRPRQDQRLSSPRNVNRKPADDPWREMAPFEYEYADCWRQALILDVIQPFQMRYVSSISGHCQGERERLLRFRRSPVPGAWPDSRRCRGGTRVRCGSSGVREPGSWRGAGPAILVRSWRARGDLIRRIGPASPAAPRGSRGGRRGQPCRWSLAVVPATAKLHRHGSRHRSRGTGRPPAQHRTCHRHHSYCRHHT
jgi:hypothetical protein